MSDTKNGLRLSAPQQQLASRIAAVALVAVAAWLGWAAWDQFRDDARRQAVTVARDSAVQAASGAIKREQQRMVERLASAPVQQALVDGDLAAAGVQLGSDWPGAGAAQVLAPDLEQAYAALGSPGADVGGFGALAALEHALASGTTVAWVARDSGKPALFIAAPARLADEVVGVARVRLPLDTIASGLASAEVADDSYLALRQGGATLVERGDPALAGGAEVLAAKVPGTELRVAAAVPGIAGGPLGMGALACAIGAALALLMAGIALAAPALARRRGAVIEDDGVPLPTLADVAAHRPEPPKVEPGPAAQPPAVDDVVAAASGTGLAIDAGIFRAYDIRGIVGTTLDAGVAQRIGQAVGTVMADQGLTDIVIGRDGRLSGPMLTEGLIAGLRRAGRNVIDIGLAPTPLVYFGAYHLRAGSCIAVTGSHNPPDYNGFKIVVGGETLAGDAITDLYRRISEDRLLAAEQFGTLQQRDINQDYVDRIAGDVQIDRPLRVVVDAGNGVAGELGPRVLAAIGAEVTPLYCEIDGTFPNHHPDPSEPHNLADLIKMVRQLDADLGIAFDGDGDRLGVVTRDGHNVFPDRLLMLFAADVLERNPGAMIIFDVKCTGRLPGHILRHGGSPLMWKTGHSLIKAKMRETDAELAGEMSGHFFFKERWYGFDDGIYAAARLLEILAGQPRAPSETLAGLPDGISTPEIKVDAPDGDPHSFVERFRSAAAFEGGRLSTIDGLRVDYPDGWGLVRASNTTPVLVLRFDADSREALARIQADFRTQLLALRPDLKLPF
ncbi:phosphomannomutase/phosphoglucomutase [Cognatilysobacter tabacisoli]|uniref:phosphomannomutase/phosphoglucomutase n=1 Tax=Cognatilysobacter tabacisoli TaxID=2315424 RepID=UPI000E6B0D0B|nr:phosphomannomutase/phosphoglucomutase [Lysobacter tabacisoli]